MEWIKKGRILAPRASDGWMSSHSSQPTPLVTNAAELRIFFASRDVQNRSRVGLVDVSLDDPGCVLAEYEEPVLDLGKLGAFDDSGVMPSCVVADGDRLLMYYTGWNQGVTVPYRNAIGLAASDDGGRTFRRLTDGPVVDRDRTDPYFTASPFVLKEAARWRMWYLSATKWTVVAGRPEPEYVIKYAESADGIDWVRDDITCIASQFSGEAVTRPWILSNIDGYRMWYSHRGSRGYREGSVESYKLGYAESTDGITWLRRDGHPEAHLETSEDGWDSEMIAYPSVFEHRGNLNLLYNGNGFGASGIGHAVGVE